MLASFLSTLYQEHSDLGIRPEFNDLENRRIRTVNRIAMSSLVVILPYLVIFLWIDHYVLFFVQVASFLAMNSILWFNKFGRYQLAKWSLIGYLHIVTFFFALAVGYEIEVRFLFYPIACLYFLLFNPKQKWIILGGMLMSVFCFILLKTEVFPALNLLVVSAEAYHNIGLISSILNLSFTIFIFGYIILNQYLYLQNLLESLDHSDQIIEEQQKVNQALSQAQIKAEAISEAKSSFLSTMSHEIRTPLNAIIGLTSVIKESELNPIQKEAFRMIRKSGENLLAIVNNILDYSKIESGKMELELEIMDLSEPLEETVELLQPEAERKGLQLHYNIAPDVPKIVFGDITRIRQILVNLVSNAVKFTDHGSVLISVSKLSKRPNKLWVRFLVSDTGIGIAPDRLKRLFRYFSQVDSSTTRKYGGTGLGLAISKNLVDMMKGNIWVKSQLNQGSMFGFELPLEQATIQTHHSLGSRNKAVPAETVIQLPPDLKILVAEDNRTNQDVLRRLMTELNYTIQIVENGQKALEMVTKNCFDLILMDIHMPVMDGILTTQKIINLFPDANDRPKIFALSADVMESTRLKCRAVGMDDFLAKPISIQDLKAVLGKWFNHSP